MEDNLNGAFLPVVQSWNNAGAADDVHCASPSGFVPRPYDPLQQSFPPYQPVQHEMPFNSHTPAIPEIDYTNIDWADPSLSSLVAQINQELMTSGMGATAQSAATSQNNMPPSSSPSVLGHCASPQTPSSSNQSPTGAQPPPSQQSLPGHSASSILPIPPSKPSSPALPVDDDFPPTPAGPESREPSPGPAPSDPNPPLSSVANDLVDQSNDSSWAARNPGVPILPIRPPGMRVVKDAEYKKAAATQKAKQAAISEAVKEAHDEYMKQLQAIADTHFVSVQKIAKLAFAPSNYKKKRGVNLINALIHAKAKQVNKGDGPKHKIQELSVMIKNDPAMQSLTPEQETAYKEDLRQDREDKDLSVRATNHAATQDYQGTVSRICEELAALAHRTGIYASLFMTRGHAYDTHAATWFGTDNALIFWEDVLKLEPSNIAKQFELWACNQGKNITQRNSLENMQRESLMLINGGFKQLVGEHTRLVYTSFEASVKEKHGVDIVGWPEGVPFTSPYNITNVELMRSLRDTLKTRQCHFVKMSPREHAAFLQELANRRRAGEVVRRERKKRSDAGSKRGKRNNTQSKKTGSAATEARATAGSEANDDDPSDDDA